MYTKEELSSMKYGELLKILKKLGLKGTRQKTDKVIELIIRNQSIEPKADEVSTPSSKANSQTENDENEISNVLDSGSEILQSSPRSEDKECHMLSNPSRRRTRTFIITKAKDTNDSDVLEKDFEEIDQKSSKENSLLEVSAVEESLLNISGCLSRSSTFIFEDIDDDLPNDSQTSSLDVNCPLDSSSIPASGDYKRIEENNEQVVLPYSNVDLSCKEIQTAEDIEDMESGKISNSPVNSRNRRSIRRSLRGQLLVSKINNPERLAPSLSTPVIENSTSELSERSIFHDQQSSLIFKPNFSVPKSFDFCKDNSTMLKGSNSKSCIPRFISNTKKLKMPNFTKIHENAFKKMEALDEYVERKHTRTLSVTDKKKPNLKGSTLSVKKEKELAFEKKNLGKKTEKETSKKLVFKETPGKKLTTPLSSSSTRRSSTMASLTKNTTTRNGRESLSLRMKTSSSSPDKVSSHPKLVKENLPPNSPLNSWNKPTTSCNTPGSLSRRKNYIPSTSKPNIKPDRNGSSVGVMAKHRAAYAGKSDNAISRREMFKRAISRKPNVKSSAEIRASEKVFIKGVRTNRRFELQMARRGIAPT